MKCNKALKSTQLKCYVLELNTKVPAQLSS